MKDKDTSTESRTLPLTSAEAKAGVREDLLAGATLTYVDPARCVVHPLNTRDVDASAEHIEQLRADILAHGQTEPAVGVPGPDDTIILLKGACRAEALRDLTYKGRRVDLAVLLLPFANELQEQRIINAEQVRTKTWSGWELAQHFDALAEIHGSNKAIERNVGGNAANIGRARSVTALPDAFLRLVADRHDISARRAAGFLHCWRGDDQKVLEACLAEIARESENGVSADELFDRCRDVLATARSVAPAGVALRSAAVLEIAGDAATVVPEVLETPAASGADAERSGGPERLPRRAENCTPAAPATDKLAVPSPQPAAALSLDRRAIARLEARPAEGERETEITGDDDQIIGRARRLKEGTVLMWLDEPERHTPEVLAASLVAAVKRLRGLATD